MKWAIIVALITGALFVSLRYLQKSPPNSYSVALDLIPQVTNPRKIRINSEFFVAAQIYYPLIQLDADGYMSSQYVDLESTRATSSDFKGYQICLKNNLKFSDGSKIEISHLEEVLKFLSTSVKEANVVVGSGNCISVSLAHRDQSYLHKLTSIESALLKNPESQIPVGLGPYRLKTVNGDMAVLEAVPGQDIKQFNIITFVKWLGPQTLTNFDWLDTNHIPRQQPQLTLRKFRQIVRPMFKPYALVINHPNRELVRKFARCFPRDAFRKIQSMTLSPSPGFFPEGVLGAGVDWRATIGVAPANDCKTNTTARPLQLLHYEQSNLEEVRNFFKRHQRELPITVEVISLSLSELVERMYTQNYVASVVGFDRIGLNKPQVEGLQYLDFFVSPHRRTRLVGTVDPNLQKIRNEMALAGSGRENVGEILVRAHRAILESGQVIPLGELVRTYYYPKEIENLVWTGVGGMSGYPEFSQMKWSKEWSL
jgi:hypothetical protein